METIVYKKRLRINLTNYIYRSSIKVPINIYKLKSYVIEYIVEHLMILDNSYTFAIHYKKRRPSNVMLKFVRKYNVEINQVCDVNFILDEGVVDLFNLDCFNIFHNTDVGEYKCDLYLSTDQSLKSTSEFPDIDLYTRDMLGLKESFKDSAIAFYGNQTIDNLYSHGSLLYIARYLSFDEIKTLCYRLNDCYDLAHKKEYIRLSKPYIDRWNLKVGDFISNESLKEIAFDIYNMYNISFKYPVHILRYFFDVSSGKKCDVFGYYIDKPSNRYKSNYEIINDMLGIKN